MELKYKYNDGGRSNYFKGKSGDCVVRAIALATGEDYKVIYDQLTQANKLYIENKNTKLAKRLRNTKYKKSGTPRSGNFKQVYKPFLEAKGWKWVSLMKFGSGERTKLNQLTHLDNVIVSVPKHLLCMKKGLVLDTWDSRYSEWLGVTSVKTANGYFIKE